MKVNGLIYYIFYRPEKAFMKSGKARLFIVDGNTFILFIINIINTEIHLVHILWGFEKM